MPENILVISDSRGKNIKPLLIDNTPITHKIKWTTQVLPGATLENIQKRLQRGTRRDNWDLIIVLAGICDFTSRSKENRNISLEYKTRKTEEVRHIIDDLYNITPNLHIATITPASLLTYSNNREKDSQIEEEQTNLEEDIKSINNYIIDKNISRDKPTLNLAKISEIRSLKKQGNKRKRVIKYDYKELRDGLHPNTDLLQKWATCICNTVTKIVPSDDSSSDEADDTWNFKRQKRT